MTHIDRRALEEAVEALAQDSDAVDLFKKMNWIIELVDKGVPAQLTGRPAILNPLVQMHAEDPEKFERVLQLVNRTRTKAGLPELVAEGDEQENTDRKVYMREFMAKKREKQATLVKLWNELRSENDKIRGTKRMEFERIHAARWQDEKKRREDAARARAGSRISEAERKAIAAKLWEDVQGELDALADFVREEMRKPLHLRSREGFQFKVGVLKKGSE